MRAVTRDELYFALLEDYGRTLVELFDAGMHLVINPGEPQWFEAQRLIVAAARARVVRVAPTRRAEARKREASIMLKLRDFANEHSRRRPAITRPEKRRRRRLQTLAQAWQEQADLLVFGEAS